LQRLKVGRSVIQEFTPTFILASPSMKATPPLSVLKDRPFR
jgi:hypothetical protein